eukprot:387736_1
MNDALETINGLKADITKLQLKKEEFEELNNELNTQKEKMETKMKDEMKEREKQKQEMAKQLKEQKEKMENKNTEDFKRYEKEKADALETINGLKADITKLQLKNKEFEELNKKSNAGLQDANKRNDALNGELAKLRAMLADKENEQKETNEQNNTLLVQKNEIEAELKQMKNQQEQEELKQRNMEQIADQLVIFDYERNDIYEAMKKVLNPQNLTELKHELDKMKEKREMELVQIKQQEDKVNDLKTQLKKQTNKVNNLEKEKQLLKHKLDEMKKEDDEKKAEPVYTIIKKKTFDFQEKTKTTEINIAVGKIADLIVGAVGAYASGGVLLPKLGTQLKNAVVNVRWSESEKNESIVDHFFEKNCYLFISIERKCKQKDKKLLTTSKSITIVAKTKMLYMEAKNPTAQKVLEERARSQAKNALEWIDKTNAGGWE